MITFEFLTAYPLSMTNLMHLEIFRDGVSTLKCLVLPVVISSLLALDKRQRLGARVQQVQAHLRVRRIGESWRGEFGENEDPPLFQCSSREQTRHF